MTNLSDAVAVIRALRGGPSSGPEIATTTGMHVRKVYRLLADLRTAGAPLRETDGEFKREGRGGSAPTLYSLSGAALVEWLGSDKRTRMKNQHGK